VPGIRFGHFFVPCAYGSFLKDPRAVIAVLVFLLVAGGTGSNSGPRGPCGPCNRIPTSGPWAFIHRTPFPFAVGLANILRVVKNPVSFYSGHVCHDTDNSVMSRTIDAARCGFVVHPVRDWPWHTWGCGTVRVVAGEVHTTQRQLYPARIRYYRDRIRRGARIGRIQVGCFQGQTWIIDGHHRWAALQLEGRAAEAKVWHPRPCGVFIGPPRVLLRQPPV
jgi:hypothetical protein